MSVGRVKEQANVSRLLFFLMILALLLTARLIYIYLDDVKRFGIHKVKVEGAFFYLQQEQIQTAVTALLAEKSWITLSSRQLRADLLKNFAIKEVFIIKTWPDTIKLTILEKRLIAIWNNKMLTEDGTLLAVHDPSIIQGLPVLKGPDNQSRDMLKMYIKLNKIMKVCDLSIQSLEKRANQSWQLIVADRVQLLLGKHSIARKVLRFIRAYPAIFAGKIQTVDTIDLRYPSGMAVSWRTQ